MQDVRDTFESGMLIVPPAYRHWATTFLDEAESRAKVFDHKADRRREDVSEDEYNRWRKEYWAIHRLGCSAILFAAIGIESFINAYGVARLREEYFKQHVERRDVHTKVAMVVLAISGKLIDHDHPMLKAAKLVFDARNVIAHSKTVELHQDKLRRTIAQAESRAWSMPGARISCRAMNDFFREFLILAPDSRIWMGRETEDPSDEPSP